MKERAETGSREICISYEPKDYQISCLCSCYFSIEGLSPKEVAKILKVENERLLSFPEAQTFLIENIIGKADKSAIKVFISYQLNNWVYVVWALSWFEESAEILKRLMKHTNQRVNCFFVDPWIDYFFWIIAEKGMIIRKFQYDGGQVLTQEGTPICQEEEIFINQNAEEQKMKLKEWAKTRDNPFATTEEVFIGIIRNSGQHIEELNKYTIPSSEFLVGTINIQ